MMDKLTCLPVDLISITSQVVFCQRHPAGADNRLLRGILLHISRSSLPILLLSRVLISCSQVDHAPRAPQKCAQQYPR